MPRMCHGNVINDSSCTHSCRFEELQEKKRGGNRKTSVSAALFSFKQAALFVRVAAIRPIEAIRAADDVRGAAFDFIVNAPDVFADDAERDELNPA